MPAPILIDFYVDTYYCNSWKVSITLPLLRPPLLLSIVEITGTGGEEIEF
jgi:hypothetical protein